VGASAGAGTSFRTKYVQQTSVLTKSDFWNMAVKWAARFESADLAGAAQNGRFDGRLTPLSYA
jgi:hypothetical protein